MDVGITLCQAYTRLPILVVGRWHRTEDERALTDLAIFESKDRTLPRETKRIAMADVLAS